MIQKITVTLPPEIRQALDELTRLEGVPADQVVGQAVKEHLFLRKFRLLRERMAAKAQSQGILTDQDVFDHTQCS